MAELTPEAPVADLLAGDQRSSEPSVLSAAAPHVLVPRTSLLPPTVLLGHGAPATSGALEESRTALDHLQGDLQGPDRRAALRRLGLISGWLQADASVRAAWGFMEESQKVAGVAAAGRDLAQKEAKDAQERCRVVEDELKTLLAMILLAASVGWKASQKANTSRLAHTLDAAVHRPIPLYGPCPQHATFTFVNPARTHEGNHMIALRFVKLFGGFHVFNPYLI